MGSKLEFNKDLFWDFLEGHIFICHLNKKGQHCYELIESPHVGLGRYLWRSNDESLCFCFGISCLRMERCGVRISCLRMISL